MTNGGTRPEVAPARFHGYSRFHVGVGEAVGVHGGEVSAAYDAHHQAGLLGVVLEGNHDAASLLQGFVFRLVHLSRSNTEISEEEEISDFICSPDEDGASVRVALTHTHTHTSHLSCDFPAGVMLLLYQNRMNMAGFILSTIIFSTFLGLKLKSCLFFPLRL